MLIWSQLHASIKIFGTAEEYAGKILEFSAYSDYITKTKTIVAKSTVDSSGYFEAHIDCKYTIQLYLELGLNEGTFYAEPNGVYELALPPFEEKTMAHKLNPYFEPFQMPIGIKNSDTLGLNYSLMKFDIEYSLFLSQNFNYLYKFSDVKLIDSVENAMETKYSYLNNEFFKAYSSYKFAILRYLTYDRDLVYACNKYLKDKPILYYNPAYMHLFVQLFEGYFTEFYRESYGRRLVEAIKYSKSPSLLNEILDEQIAFRNDTLKELIVLKGLNDAFNKPEVYPRNTVQITLDSMLTQTTIEEHILIAKNIENKQKVLIPGDQAPEFELEDIIGNKVTRESYNDKYVYLMFCRSESYTCQEDYKLLHALHEEHLPDLKIVTVGFEEEKSVLTDFLLKNEEYSWDFLYAGEDNAIKNDYQIKAFPTYMLLDPDGKIAILPAPSPHENFKWSFNQIIMWRERAKRMEEMRNREH